MSPGHSQARKGETAPAEPAGTPRAESPAFIEDTVALRDTAQREAAQERQERLEVVSAPRRGGLPGRMVAAAALGVVPFGCVVALVLNQGSAAPPRARLAQRPAPPHSRPAPRGRAVPARQIRRGKASHGGARRASLRRASGQRPHARAADRKAPAHEAPAPPAPAIASAPPAAAPEPSPASGPTSVATPPQHPAPSPTPVSKEFGFER